MGCVGISVMSYLTSLVDMFIMFIDGAVHRESHYAPYVECNIHIYYMPMTLYMYHSVWDVVVGSLCTMVV